MNLLTMGRVLPGMALLCLFSACEGGHSVNSYAEAGYANIDSVSYAYDPGTSEIPTQPLKIRKGEMNFKVKELQKTSQEIASCVNKLKGEVLESHLSSEIQNSNTKKINADSLMEVIAHRQTNTIIIRVPSENLDSLMSSVEEFSLLLHSKDVTTENVSLDYLSDELKVKNMARLQRKHEAVTDLHKESLGKYTNATLNTMEIQNGVIDRQIDNLRRMDQVKFSTLKLSIYQDAIVYTNVMPDINADSFGPGFGASARMALQEGWTFLLELFLFLVRIWPVYGIVAILFIVIRYVDRTFRPKMMSSVNKE
jgi:hypothetical protein